MLFVGTLVKFTFQEVIHSSRFLVLPDCILFLFSLFSCFLSCDQTWNITRNYSVFLTFKSLESGGRAVEARFERLIGID